MDDDRRHQGATVDGTATWSNVGFGHYVVHEITAPQGCELREPRRPGGHRRLERRRDVRRLDAGPEAQDPAHGQEDRRARHPARRRSLPAVSRDQRHCRPAVGRHRAGRLHTAADGTCTLPEGSDSFEIAWPNTYYWAETARRRATACRRRESRADRPRDAGQHQGPVPDVRLHRPEAGDLHDGLASSLPDGTITDYADTSPASRRTPPGRYVHALRSVGTGLNGTQYVDASKLVTSKDVNVNGPGRYPTGTVVLATVTKPGTYYWYVTFTSTPATRSVGPPCRGAAADKVVTINPPAQCSPLRPPRTRPTSTRARHHPGHRARTTGDAGRDWRPDGERLRPVPVVVAELLDIAGGYLDARRVERRRTGRTTRHPRVHEIPDRLDDACSCGPGRRLLLLEGFLRRRRQQRIGDAPVR